MTDDDRAEREYVRKLFGTDEPEPEREPATGSNHVPREGGSPGPDRPADYDDRNFAGELFGVDENARNLHQGGGETFRDWTRELFGRAGIWPE